MGVVTQDHHLLAVAEVEAAVTAEVAVTVDPGLLRGEQHVPLNERRGGLGVLNTAGALHQRRVHLHLRRGRESLLLQTAAQEREGALLPGRMFPTMVQIIA